MEMCQKLFYLIGTLITRNSAKPVSLDRCQTKRQSFKRGGQARKVCSTDVLVASTNEAD